MVTHLKSKELSNSLLKVKQQNTKPTKKKLMHAHTQQGDFRKKLAVYLWEKGNAQRPPGGVY